MLPHLNRNPQSWTHRIDLEAIFSKGYGITTMEVSAGRFAHVSQRGHLATRDSWAVGI